MIAFDVRTDYLSLAARYAAAPDQWPVAPRFNPAQRWYHRIAQATDHEVWLLTWLPGQSTDLHDHGGSAGAFHVLSGSLSEDTVIAGTPVRIAARDFGDGAGRSFGSRHIHRIANRSVRPAISIHVYAPALTTMTRYRVSGPRLEVAEVEKAGVQW